MTDDLIQLADEAIFEQLAALRDQFMHEKQAGEFTVSDYQKQFGITRRKADYQLEKLVDTGRVSRRKSGHYAFYRLLG